MLLLWFHVGATWPAFHGSVLIQRSAAYGWGTRGTFFLISGFVIPMALYKVGYRIRDIGNFMLRRVARLYPPYLVTVAAILALHAAISVRNGSRFDITQAQVLAHIVLANDILGLRWLSPVFWTLSVEFQYYLLVAICFPLLMHRKRAIRVGMLLVLIVSPLVLVSSHVLFRYLGPFMMGFFVFRFRITHVTPWTFRAGLVVTAIVTGLSMGVLVAGAALVTAFIIAYLPSRMSLPLSGVGRISYSLYLVHWPIANNVMVQVAKHTTNLSVRRGTLALAIGASLLAAYILNRFVERPSHILATRIRLSREGPGNRVGRESISQTQPDATSSTMP